MNSCNLSLEKDEIGQDTEEQHGAQELALEERFQMSKL